MFTADEWKIKIEEFKKSGLSQIAWCKTNGIKYHQLKYWLYRLRDLEKAAQKPTFKELKLAPASSIKLKWQNITLEINHDFDEVVLKRFLRALV